MMKWCKKINLQEPQRNRKLCQFNKDQYCNCQGRCSIRPTLAAVKEYEYIHLSLTIPRRYSNLSLNTCSFNIFVCLLCWRILFPLVMWHYRILYCSVSFRICQSQCHLDFRLICKHLLSPWVKVNMQISYLPSNIFAHVEDL